jgi:hypothetical protein
MENEQQLSYFFIITVVNDPAFRRKSLLTPARPPPVLLKVRPTVLYLRQLRRVLVSTVVTNRPTLVYSVYVYVHDVHVHFSLPLLLLELL